MYIRTTNNDEFSYKTRRLTVTQKPPHTQNKKKDVSFIMFYEDDKL